MWMSARSYEPEILDVETPSPDELKKCYVWMKAINRWLGGVSATLSWFEHFSRHWSPGETIRVLDVGAGSADIPRALIIWASKRGFSLTVTALDIDLDALKWAREDAGEEGMRFLSANVLRIPCRPGAFDYVTSSLFFHHLTDEQIIEVLSAMDGIARRGIVINDLARSRSAWILSQGLMLFANRIVKNDGPLSIKKSLRVDEACGLIERSGLGYLTTQGHPFYRLTIAGEKA